MRTSQVATKATLVAAGLCLSCANAEAADFRGKTISLAIGFGVGGGYDIYGRLLARHLGQHLPGEPSVVVHNMVGAGGLLVANHIYNVAPKDGTAIALLASSSVIEPLLGNEQAKFDTGRFTWIGNMAPTITACGVWHTAGVDGWQAFLSRPLRFGATGPGGITAQHARVLRHLFKADIKLITAYKGIVDVGLAMQRGEVDGACGLFLSSDGPLMSEIRSGSLKIVIQFGPRQSPFHDGGVNVYDLTPTDAERKVAEFVFRQTDLARPIAAPPGVSDDVVSALRAAFDAAIGSPPLLAEARKAGVEIEPMKGEAVAQAFASFARTPPEIIERAKQATGSD